eukprot:Tamp_27689.p3 GENE.Tamp_27689~~Tamp_27689.p3  ORF type:complete len:102 (+),score=5.90 Tamp_27689:334-639(+)
MSELRIPWRVHQFLCTCTWRSGGERERGEGEGEWVGGRETDRERQSPKRRTGTEDSSRTATKALTGRLSNDSSILACCVGGHRAQKRTSESEETRGLAGAV